MAKKVIYIDRDGFTISKDAWTEHKNNPEYVTVRKYDNAVVHVELKWNGRVDQPDTFPDYYPVFVLLVKNYREDGTSVNDPVDGDKTFPDEESGIKAYEEFLARWTECEVRSDGGFIERDNALTPPPPDQPSSAPIEDVGCEGAW